MVKKILLVCSAGMSTSILVNKMKAAAVERNVEAEIEAHGYSDVSRFNGKYDCCLVGPQIRYAKSQIEKSLPDMPVDVIDMKIYGLADGNGALDQALKLIGTQN